jgi:hypothetical protein
MTDLISILFPKSRNLVKHNWIERWLAENGATDTERFLEAMHTHLERQRKK